MHTSIHPPFPLTHTLFCMFVALTITIGCKQAGAPQAITHDAILNMRYMAKTETVRAEARFSARKQGAQTPEQASFNQANMRQFENFGGLFVFQGASTPINQVHSFSWSGASVDKEIKSDVAMSKMEESHFTSATLSHSIPAKLRWKGAPLGAAESIVLLWENTATRETVTTQAMGANSEPVLDLPAFEVRKVPVGKYKLTIIRKKLVETDQANYHIKSQSEYYAAPIEVEVRVAE
jgi:hypothetical protein